MRKRLIAILAVFCLVAGCTASGHYNTQQGAAIGAGIGALTGQAIGHNAKSTLIGTGVGTLLGAIIGNGVDQQQDIYRSDTRYYRSDDRYYSKDGNYYGRYYGEETAVSRQPPPGRWVTVPGHWEGRRWVPPHEVWMPVDPR